MEEKLLPTRASLLDEWNVTVISAGYGHSAVLTVNVSELLQINLFSI